MALSLKPLGNRVVVEPIEQEEVTAGGIVLPETAKEKPQEAEIVAVGKGKTSDEGKVLTPEVKVGDKVLFGKYSGTEITVADNDYLILREADILAVVE